MVCKSTRPFLTSFNVTDTSLEDILKTDTVDGKCRMKTNGKKKERFVEAQGRFTKHTVIN